MAKRMTGGMITDKGIAMVAPVEFKAGDVIVTQWGSKTVASVDDYLVKYTNGTADPAHVLSGLVAIGKARKAA